MLMFFHRMPTYKDYFMDRQKKLSHQLKDLRQDTTLLMLPTAELMSKKRLHDSIQSDASDMLRWHRKINKSILQKYTRKSDVLSCQYNNDDFYSVKSSLESEHEDNDDPFVAPKDGNCFFHCCAKVLRCGHMEVRLRCTSHLRQNKKFRKRYGISLKDVEYLEYSGNWNNNAMDFIPKIVSDLYNIVVEIRNYCCYSPPNPLGNIRLKYQEDHYDLIK